MAKGRRVSPWWLEDGTEICPICHQLYLYETEYRCADCDGAICTDCVRVMESLTVICEPCLDAREPASKAATGV